jgi:hypothetical protein
VVSNYGTETITEVTITLQMEENTPISKSFNATIGNWESIHVYFDETLNYNEIGEYKVKMTAETPHEFDEYSYNNTTETIVKIVAPITEIPFGSDFSNMADCTNWNPEHPGGWAINYNAYYWAVEENIPLLSRCITLKPDYYRLTYSFWAGYFEATDDFYVTYGKSGTNPSTWTPLKQYYNYNTEGLTMVDDITVNITEQGEYVFAFFPTRLGGTVRVYSTTIDLVPEHDFKINNIESHSFPNMIPENHCEGMKSFNITVENRGRSAERGKIEIKHNEQIMGSNTFELPAGSNVKNVAVDAIFNPLPTGMLTFKFNASIESGISKSLVLNKMVSDSTFAWDYIDWGFETGLGINGIPCSLGLLYELGKKDFLTSINVGLYEREEGFPTDEEFGLAVYKLNNNMTLGEIVYQVNHTRGTGNNNGGTTFAVPNIEMLPGKYFFEIRQLNEYNVAVAYDNEPDGYFYDNTDNYLTKINGFGYIHLRPNFGNPPLNISTNKKQEAQLNLYPNPASGMLNIKLKDINIDKVTISNSLGIVVHQSSNIDNSLYRYNTSHLSCGLYFISVHTQTGVINSKFVVK